MIELKDICKSFGDHVVLKNFSLKINKNEFIAIIGESGAGKTTILNMISMIDKPDSGSISINGKNSFSKKDVQDLRRYVFGYIFQNYALIENDTVKENLLLSKKYRKDFKEKELGESLEKVGISKEYLGHKVCELSGGEQQRIAIARTMLKPCEIILADEPTGNLDTNNKEKIIHLFKELKKEGYELEIKEYSDYVQPNTALESGDLDANYFQHKPYLDDFNKQKKTHLVSAGTIHYEPFGIFPGKTKTLKALKNGATVAVPNDTTNEARALLLLQDQGLIKLKDGAGLTATKKDIVENKKDLAIKEIEAAQIPRSLKDVDIAVVNGNYALEAGLKVNKDALATEDADSIGAKTYGNVVAVKKGNEKTDATKALIKALKSDTVKKYINDKYDGAVVPLF